MEAEGVPLVFLILNCAEVVLSTTLAALPNAAVRVIGFRDTVVHLPFVLTCGMYDCCLDAVVLALPPKLSNGNGLDGGSGFGDGIIIGELIGEELMGELMGDELIGGKLIGELREELPPLELEGENIEEVGDDCGGTK